MKNSLKIIFSISVLILFNSCIKEELTLKQDEFYPEQVEVPTEIKGNVKDAFLNGPAVGQEVKIIKYWENMGSKSQVVATVLTDLNGNYSCKFNHKEEQYKKNMRYIIGVTATGKYTRFLEDIPYYVYKGQTGIRNVELLKIVTLKCNLQVTNNTNGWLDVTHKFNTYFYVDFDAQRITQPNGNILLTIRSVANASTEIRFDHRKNLINGGYLNSSKTINYNTTSADMQELNYVIDCATFN